MSFLYDCCSSDDLAWETKITHNHKGVASIGINNIKKKKMR